MRMSFKSVTCMMLFFILTTVPYSFAQAEKLIGVWGLTELAFTGPDARTVSVPTDKQPPSVIIFTKKYMSLLGNQSPKPRPELPQNATDALKVAAWESIMARMGTYEVKGSTIIWNIMWAKNPNLEKGFSIIMDYKIGEDTLSLTFKEYSSGPVEYPYTEKFKRLE